MVQREFFILSAAALAVAVGLAGCSDGDTDAAPKAATPSEPVTVSATPTPTAPPPPATPYPHPTPEEPQGMYQHTDGGAIATAQYFVELIGYQASTGDTSKMQRISLPECKYCARLMKYDEHVIKSGGWVKDYETTNMTLVGYGPPPDGQIGDLGVRIDVAIPEIEYFIHDENGEGADKAGTFEAALLLEWKEDRWMILEGSGRNND